MFSGLDDIHHPPRPAYRGSHNQESELRELMKMTVLVIGATGKSGRPVVDALTARGVRVGAASRNPAAAPAGGSIIPVGFDWADRTTWAAALEGAESLYIVGPYAHPTGEVLVGDLLAEAHDTRRVVLLSVIGAEQLPVEAMMAHWERSVRASGKEWTVLHPNWFFQNFGTGFARPCAIAAFWNCPQAMPQSASSTPATSPKSPRRPSPRTGTRTRP